MDLSTTYLGMRLKNPLVAAAGPLTADLGKIRHLEDAGASAVVLHSLFEEQLRHEADELDHYLSHGAESYAEALSYFPEAGEYKLGPEEYLEHVAAAKKAVGIPVIGSLNGVSVGGWTEYAKKIEQAGADALELNVYFIATDFAETGAQVEERYLEVLQAVKRAVRIPVAIKIGPFFSSMAWMARRLDQAGADALVLFNRFYQPDFDLENLAVVPDVVLSTPFEMRLPLRWIAILYGNVKASLAAARGISTAEDVIKMIMAGADITQMLSVLLRKGIGQLGEIELQMREWMEQHEYVSIEQMKGSMSQKSCADPAAFERANYMRTLQSYV